MLGLADRHDCKNCLCHCSFNLCYYLNQQQFAAVVAVMARGPKRHLKRLNAPGHWMLVGGGGQRRQREREREQRGWEESCCGVAAEAVAV